MIEEPTEEDLLKLGQKAYERKQRDRLLTQAHYKATKRLISANQEQFSTYLDEAKRELGL